MHDKNEDLRLREVAFPLLGKWVPFILLTLSEGDKNFSDLDKELKGVSRKVLTENLTNLVASGIVNKEGKTSTGHPVYYSLTDLGKSILPILNEVKTWLKNNESELTHNKEKFLKPINHID